MRAKTIFLLYSIKKKEVKLILLSILLRNKLIDAHLGLTV